MKKYPYNWQWIRGRVLHRDNYQCQFCGKEKGDFILKIGNGKYIDAPIEQLMKIDGEEEEDTILRLFELIDPTGRLRHATALKRLNLICVVLQVMHVNHDIEDNRMSNLITGCRCCHLKHDAKRHGESRKYGKWFRIKQIRMEF